MRPLPDVGLEAMSSPQTSHRASEKLGEEGVVGGGGGLPQTQRENFLDRGDVPPGTECAETKRLSR